MRFAAPLNLWLLLLLPLLAIFLAWAQVARRRVLTRFATWEMAERLTEQTSSRRPYLRAGLLLLGAGCLVLAMGRPQFGAKLSLAQRRGVDVVIALDVSRSMLAEDVKPSRMARARQQIRELLDLLEGDRVGLVLFAGTAFVQCPLTLDYGAVEMLLDAADVASVSAQGTALGQAIRVAAGCFEAGDRQHKVILLFTDGEDHLGQPVEAATEVAGQGVRIFAVGLGTPAGELIPQQAATGGVSFHRDQEGQYVKTHLSEAVLRQVALAADGEYHRSSLGGQELEEIHDQISGMDQKQLGSTRMTRYEERYQIPLLLSLLCFFTDAVLGDGSRRQREWRGRFA